MNKMLNVTVWIFPCDEDDEKKENYVKYQIASEDGISMSSITTMETDEFLKILKKQINKK